MSDEETVIKSPATSLFVQFQPGKESYWLGTCTSLDGIPNPRGGYDPIICRDGMGKLKIVSDKPTAPEMITFTIERLHSRVASWLDKANCPFTLFALQRCEGNEGVFKNWIAGQIVGHCKLTNDPVTNISQRDAADEMLHSYEITARPPRLDPYEMIMSQKTVSPAEDANTISGCAQISCAEGCGTQQDNPCDIILVGLDSDGANPPDVLYSLDGGVTWAVMTTPPHALTENITSIRCFPIDATTTRVIAARSTAAATALEIQYTDDFGASAWTNVVVGATVAEYVERDAGIFVLDGNHIWVCTDQGNVYFSNDGGLTYTLQTSAVVASGGAALHAIKFISELVGYAVGATDVVIKTTDGGVNWVAASATGGGGTNQALAVHSRNRLSVGDSTGSYYMSYDGAVTWVAITQWTGADTGAITSISFINEFFGVMTHNDGGGVGRLLRTIDGGYSWLRISGVTFAAGLHASYYCDLNHAFACGDDDGAMAVVAEAGMM